MLARSSAQYVIHGRGSKPVVTFFGICAPTILVYISVYMSTRSLNPYSNLSTGGPSQNDSLGCFVFLATCLAKQLGFRTEVFGNFP